jgi:eukaryotic-like serine/threonine-protein kinase
MCIKNSNTTKSNIYSSLCFVVVTFILAFYYLWFFTVETNLSFQSAAGLPTASNNFLTYGSSVYGFKIQYPSTWQRIEFSGEVEEGNRKIIVNFVSQLENPSDTFREYFIIERGPVGPHTESPLRSSVNTYITWLKSLPDFKLIESNTVPFAQSSAEKLVYSYNNPEVGVTKSVDMLTIKNNKLYLLSFNSDAIKYNNYLPAIQKMLDSFSFS